MSGDYRAFGALVAGVLDDYVASDTASATQTLSLILDLASTCGVTVNPDAV